MAVLRTLRGSTMMETMVATVLIVVIFMMASLIMNTLLETQYKSNSMVLDNKLRKIRYLYENKQVQIPYHEAWNSYEISIEWLNGQNGKALIKVMDDKKIVLQDEIIP